MKFLLILSIVCIHIKGSFQLPLLTKETISDKDDCIKIPQEAEDWDIVSFDMKLAESYPIVSRPKCKKPSENNRRQFPAIISVFAPDFSDFSKVAYRFDKNLITTSCYKPLFGANEHLVLSRRRIHLNLDDEQTIQNSCKDGKCIHALTSLMVGESRLWPSPEEYDCNYFKTTPKTVSRFVITAISMQINSHGIVLNPSMGTDCNVNQSFHCIHGSKQFALSFPLVKIDECAANLRVVAPGVLSINNEENDSDNSTYVSLPDQKMTFWFPKPISEIPILCVLNEIQVRRSEDGYLLGISSIEIPESETSPDSPSALKSLNLTEGPISKHLKQTKSRTKRGASSSGNDGLQRSYTRAEMQFGLRQINQELETLRRDINYEVCKIRAQLWDNAYTHLWDNPDLFARFLFPFENVKGIFENNMLKVIHGKSMEELCIPRIPTFTGLHIKLMIQGQPYWLHASTGELLSSGPKSTTPITVSSFVIPTYPEGSYDILSGTYLQETSNHLIHSSANISLFFSGDEMHSVQELTSWSISHQRTEDRIVQDVAPKIVEATVYGSFDDYIVQPVTQTWKGFKSTTQNTIAWISFILIICILLYVLANIILPSCVAFRKLKVKEKENHIREKKLELQRTQLKSF